MGKWILITGVSKGLGYAMTEGFIAQGNTVIGCARSKVIVEKMKQDIDKLMINPCSLSKILI
ncbi:SDR family NAD(P)-dependent oxidoreductase [Nostoc sp. FACHB-87]|uniref:SDR family NAD(P)-dependent oxidoreductase n=1 Tax=Nostocaceae TaxID=1162 RepID=UPI001686507F|nr:MULTISPECIES: SDR family NAD(P)-dependent oxidoreductase [Nostocaceae]MBD2457323.1 SDR family NAD(P)-dependent oxidoreductase [Nostoc sp. FACHB-87]MBD2478392.1 SDR family NAD(P)-dependent oxidoreductase [Anabaena sp. FACHB-83]